MHSKSIFSSFSYFLFSCVAAAALHTLRHLDLKSTGLTRRDNCALASILKQILILAGCRFVNIGRTCNISHKHFPCNSLRAMLRFACSSMPFLIRLRCLADCFRTDCGIMQKGNEDACQGREVRVAGELYCTASFEYPAVA